MTFDQALRLAGLLPRSILADGKWRRCPTEDKPKKRNGAYVLHPDGRGYFKNWATDLELSSWRDDNAAQGQRIDPAKLKAQRDRDREYRVASMRRMRAFWSASRPLNRPHPYVQNKGLTPLGCAGLRENDGLLVVPVMHGQSLISVQTIAPDGAKRFWTGAPVKAGAFVMKRERSAVTCICEGLATGLAVYQSVRQASVIVAFDAGNLLPVVDRMRPSGSVVIVADNDHRTQARIGTNPGIEKATNAAELIGCGVAYPEGIEGSDWADYLKENGPESARKIERLILSKARYVSA